MNFKFELTVVAFLVGIFSGCVTTFKTAVTAEEFDARLTQFKEVAGAPGFLGMTGDLRFASYYSGTKLKLELLQVEKGEKMRVLVEESKGSNTGAGLVALLTPLPAGRYKMLASTLEAPGGQLDGKRYAGVSGNLNLQFEIREFVIRPGEFLHVGKFRVEAAQFTSDEKIFTQWNSLVDLSMPDAQTWSVFLPKLKNLPSSYMKKTSLGSIEIVPLTWDSAKNPEVAVQREVGARRPTLNSGDVRKGMRAVNGEMLSCRINFAPKKAGRIEFQMVIAPSGNVHDAKVSASEMGSAQNDECMLRALRRAKFPRTPDDDFEQWSWTLTF